MAGVTDGHLQKCGITHGTHLEKKNRAACNIGVVPCQAILWHAAFFHAVYKPEGLPYSVQ